MPTLHIESLFSSTKIYKYYDEAIIIDEANGLKGMIKYNPSFNKSVGAIAYRQTIGWIPGMNGLGNSKSANRAARADDISIEILKKDGKKDKVVSSGHGSWLSHIIIDNKEMWRVESYIPQWILANKFSDGSKLLESDSANR